MKKISRILICILLIVAIVFSIVMITKRFMDRSLGMSYQYKSFYAQERDTVDVLFVGSSRVHSNIDPAGLWENYGIPAYDLASNSQTIDVSYYALKEALKYQSPKVVVVEVSQIPANISQHEGFPTVCGMAYDENYIGAATENYEGRDKIENLFVFPFFHSRYDMVDKEEYVEDDFNCYPMSHAAGYKGAIEHLYREAFPAYTDEYALEGEIFDEEVEGYMDRIVKLCEDKGINLLLTLSPAAHKIEQIGVVDYVERHPGLDYINCSDYVEEMGLDPENDFVDIGHMNMQGAMKTGKFLGEYLKNKYNLEDRRSDAKYYSWEENSAYRIQKEKNGALSQINGFGDYFNNFPNSNYFCVIALLDGYDDHFIGQLDALKYVSCNEEVYKRGGVWIIDGNETVYAALGYENEGDEILEAGSLRLGRAKEECDENSHILEANWHGDVGNRSIEVIRSADDFKILLDSEDVAVYKDMGKTLCNNGIEIFVFDKLSEQMVDCVCFDSTLDFSAIRGSKVSK